MVVVRCNRNGMYRLAELDGAVLRLRYVAFWLIPYYACLPSYIPIIRVVDCDNLTSVIADDLPMHNDQQAVMMPGDGQI
jgi:hypothetical protein